MGPDTDLDLLVVVPDGVHRRRTAQTIYRCLNGLGFAKDIVVATESDIRQYEDNPSLVIYPALTEGKDFYHAAGLAARHKNRHSPACPFRKAQDHRGTQPIAANLRWLAGNK